MLLRSLLLILAGGCASGIHGRIQFSPDERSLAMVRSSLVASYDLQTNSTRWQQPITSEQNAVVFSADDAWMLVTELDSDRLRLTVRKTLSGEVKLSTTTDAQRGCWIRPEESFAVTDDGAFVACSMGGVLRVFSAATRAAVYTFDLYSAWGPIAFAPKTHQLVVATEIFHLEDPPSQIAFTPKHVHLFLPNGEFVDFDAQTGARLSLVSHGPQTSQGPWLVDGWTSVTNYVPVLSPNGNYLPIQRKRPRCADLSDRVTR